MSWQMRALGGLFRVVYKRRFTTHEAGLRRLAAPKGSAEPPRRVLRDRRTERYEVGGFPVVVLHPRAGAAASKPAASGPAAAGVVVHLHGGAYTSEVVAAHWRFVAHLADRTGRPVHVPLYGLAPAHDAVQALAFTGAVVARLAADGVRVHLVGDSAGGGLALLTAQHAEGEARDALVGVSVMAPWLDMALANPEIPRVERDDPWLSRAGLVPVAEVWVAGTPLTDPTVSPLHGDLAGLPPLALWVGTRDITLPDCRLLRDRMRDHPSFRYVELDGGLHVYPLLPVPEGRRARDEIADHVAATLA